jgi:gliding motility associated protien GldN
MKKSVIIFVFFLHLNGMPQENLPGVFNTAANPCAGLYSENTGSKKPVPYTHLREADVAWEKRVWREIDLREKQNQFLYYPLEPNPCRASLFQALNKSIFTGEVIAFADEEFMVPYSAAEVRGKIVKVDTLDRITYDINGEEKHESVPVADSTSVARRILKYRLKEDWFFDRQKSTLEVRIIGIAVYEWVEEKEVFKELYWVYFPTCRPMFAATETFNTRNDKEGRSYDEVFLKRQFSSVVIKESNVYDRYISEYAKGIDALSESDNIKMDIFSWEHDLWHF